MRMSSRAPSEAANTDLALAGGCALGLSDATTTPPSLPPQGRARFHQSRALGAKTVRAHLRWRALASALHEVPGAAGVAGRRAGAYSNRVLRRHNVHLYAPVRRSCLLSRSSEAFPTAASHVAFPRLLLAASPVSPNLPEKLEAEQPLLSGSVLLGKLNESLKLDKRPEA